MNYLALHDVSSTFESPTYDEPCAHELSAHIAQVSHTMDDSAQPSRVLYSAGSEPVDPWARSLENALNRAEGIPIDDYLDEDDPFFCDGDGDEQGKSYHLMHRSI